ncbi:MAG: cell division protein FtsZ [Alphaproteobacteria bacterium]|nr:cell division protein FtsZ [Alphaproteobacteria bacterium]
MADEQLTSVSLPGADKQGDFFNESTFSDSAAYLRPKITVIGVGGAGGNAVNNMIKSDLKGVEFVVANADAQALMQSLCEKRIQLGLEITRGLGAGARPDVGRAAAEEATEEIVSHVKNSNMVFITAGMGGGTGTGAAPVVARIAKEMGILTIGVVTKPFHFEGTNRMRFAEKGLDELQQYVDTLIVIPNQNLFRVANEKTTFADAFKMADNVLRSGVQGVTDLMVMPGLINLDFADIKTVMSEMGKAMMGTGEAEGERRAIDAAESAISNPLLDDVSMKGAKGILINITGGYDMTLYEVDEAANRIREEVDPEARIIFGSTFNEKMEGRMRVSVVATGIDAEAIKEKMQRIPTDLSISSTNASTDISAEVSQSSKSEEVSSVAGSESQSTQSVSGNYQDNSVKRSEESRKPSLFERLTGIRSFSSRKQEQHTFQASSVKASPDHQEEDLEIPAFLRRNS